MKKLLYAIIIAQLCSLHAKSVVNHKEITIRSFDIDELQIAATRPVPLDVSFLIADLKFDGKSVKILEFGEGPRSYFRGHEKLFGQGKIWERFWHYLGQFKVPVWYVGKPLDTDYKLRQIAEKTFAKIGGSFVPNIHKLKRSKIFKELCKTEYTQSGHYVGVVVLRHHRMPKVVINKFKKDYPQFLILDTATTPFVNNKHKTAQVFEDTDLSLFKPQWRIYKKKYTPQLANTIVSDFGEHVGAYVIKPLNAANGWGVLIVEATELDETLKTIFSKRDELRNFTDKSYSYWYKDNNRNFLVEEYVASKVTTVRNKPFDGTMRVVFTLDYEPDNVNITFLGGYWKLPCKSLNDKGSLTDLHKSKINPSFPSSTKISGKDFKKVKGILKEILPKLYASMVGKSLQ